MKSGQTSLVTSEVSRSSSGVVGTVNVTCLEGLGTIKTSFDSL